MVDNSSPTSGNSRSLCAAEPGDAMEKPQRKRNDKRRASATGKRTLAAREEAEKAIREENDTSSDGTGLDDGSASEGGKKKKHRLLPEQLEILQKYFKENDRLDAATKAYLSVKLKLPPRQVEVWFQNCRVRVKKKTTEERYAFYKTQYQKQLEKQKVVEEDNQRLTRENSQLRSLLRAFLISNASGQVPSNLVAANFVAAANMIPMVNGTNPAASTAPGTNAINVEALLQQTAPSASQQAVVTEAELIALTRAENTVSNSPATLLPPDHPLSPNTLSSPVGSPPVPSSSTSAVSQRTFGEPSPGPQRLQCESGSVASPSTPAGAIASLGAPFVSPSDIPSHAAVTQQADSLPLRISGSSPVISALRDPSLASAIARPSTSSLVPSSPSPGSLGTALIGSKSGANSTISREQAVMRILQSALDAFVQRASVGQDLSKIMEDMCVIVGRALRSEYVKVLELLQGSEAFLLRSGIGWRRGLVGHALVGTSHQSQSGYALVTNRPVIVENFHTETRFNWPTLHQGHGVFSGVSVVIGSKCQSRPYGVLGLHSTKRRMFTQGEVWFMEAMSSALSDAIDRFNIPHLLSRSNDINNRFLVDEHNYLSDLICGDGRTQDDDDDHNKISIENMDDIIEGAQCIDMPVFDPFSLNC